MKITDLLSPLREAKAFGDPDHKMWINPSGKDLVSLSNRFGDMRGVVTSGNVFVSPAFNNTHLDMVYNLGMSRFDQDHLHFIAVNHDHSKYDSDGREIWDTEIVVVQYYLGNLIIQFNREFEDFDDNLNLKRLLKRAEEHQEIYEAR